MLTGVEMLFGNVNASGNVILAMLTRVDNVILAMLTQVDCTNNIFVV